MRCHVDGCKFATVEKKDLRKEERSWNLASHTLHVTKTRERWKLKPAPTLLP
jgi:hypothetical protein